MVSPGINLDENFIEIHTCYSTECIWTYRFFIFFCFQWSHPHVNLYLHELQYIPRNMRTVLALLCFVVVIHWLIFPNPPGLLHWHCGNLTIAPVPAKQPWWIWINTSCEFIMNDCITTTKQSTTKPCAYFLGYTVHELRCWRHADNTCVPKSMFVSFTPANSVNARRHNRVL